MRSEWPGAPKVWNYTTLADAEGCARRWSLRVAGAAGARALTDHGTTWGRARGRACHAAVERLISIHRDRSGPPPNSTEIQAFWRAHLPQGLRALVRDALELEAARESPRDDLRARRWVEDELRRSVPVVSAFIRLALASMDRSGTGVHVVAEVDVAATLDGGPCGAWTGRIDAVSRTPGTAVVIDFKSGKREAGHRDQIRTYDVLFSRDDRVNRGARVIRLAIVYGDGSVDAIEPPDAHERSVFATELVARASAAARAIEQRPPLARPLEDACPSCEVRGACDAYWAAREGWAPPRTSTWDGEVQIVGRSSSRTALEVQCADGRGALLFDERTAPYCTLLSAGDRARVVGARRRRVEHGTDDGNTWIIEAVGGTMVVKT